MTAVIERQTQQSHIHRTTREEFARRAAAFASVVSVVEVSSVVLRPGRVTCSFCAFATLILRRVAVHRSRAQWDAQWNRAITMRRNKPRAQLVHCAAPNTTRYYSRSVLVWFSALCFFVSFLSLLINSTCVRLVWTTSHVDRQGNSALHRIVWVM